MTRRFTLLLGLCFSCALLGCHRADAASGEAVPGASATAQAALAVPGQSKVTKIVFVDKEHACDCTRKTVEAGWAALQQALGTPAKLPVERLQIDTQPDKVAPYRAQKAIVALPAIYFLDGSSIVLELLQGEVTADAIATVLRNR